MFGHVRAHLGGIPMAVRGRGGAGRRWCGRVLREAGAGEAQRQDETGDERQAEEAVAHVREGFLVDGNPSVRAASFPRMSDFGPIVSGLTISAAVVAGRGYDSALRHAAAIANGASAAAASA